LGLVDLNSFEQSLARVLDPEHYLWSMITDDQGDSSRARLVEIRLDIPKGSVAAADKDMIAAGWQLASRPDEHTDALERLFWRKTTAVLPQDITSLLTSALRVAHEHQGTLMSWMNVEDLEAS
jgi:hypothetical protein